MPPTSSSTSSSVSVSTTIDDQVPTVYAMLMRNGDCLETDRIRCRAFLLLRRVSRPHTLQRFRDDCGTATIECVLKNFAVCSSFGYKRPSKNKQTRQLVGGVRNPWQLRPKRKAIGTFPIVKFLIVTNLTSRVSYQDVEIMHTFA